MYLLICVTFVSIATLSSALRESADSSEWNDEKRYGNRHEMNAMNSGGGGMVGFGRNRDENIGENHRIRGMRNGFGDQSGIGRRFGSGFDRKRWHRFGGGMNRYGRRGGRGLGTENDFYGGEGFRNGMYGNHGYDGSYRQSGIGNGGYVDKRRNREGMNDFESTGKSINGNYVQGMTRRSGLPQAEHRSDSDLDSTDMSRRIRRRHHKHETQESSEP